MLLLLTPGLRALDPNAPDGDPGQAGADLLAERTGTGGPKIRCPKCAWEPRAEDRWQCDHCGFFWNTFDTRGLCPACDHQWEETMCPRCGEWSPHEDWYSK